MDYFSASFWSRKALEIALDATETHCTGKYRRTIFCQVVAMGTSYFNNNQRVMLPLVF
jgi:hypothetical protein